MTDDPIVERALNLARTSKCTTVTQIRNQLAREGFRTIGSALTGADLTNRLRLLMAERRRLVRP